MTLLARPLEAFFTQRLLRDRQASPHTVAAYRDCFRLLLSFAQERVGKPASSLEITDLDAPLIGAFLEHLEGCRHNTARTRNARLAAIHSFFSFLAVDEPTHAATINRVLAMPTKRYTRRPIDYLTREEMDALLAAPDLQTWVGRRDRLLIHLALQTGLRVSELVGLRCDDIRLGPGAHVRCHGKGRRDRCTPLRHDAVAAVRAWLAERRAQPDAPLIPTAQGRPMSRDAVERRLTKYAALARRHCPSLRKKHISPHVLRHSTAMDLLHRGVDRSVIALWLGHESYETTQMYVQADMALKEQALARTVPLPRGRTRYRPSDDLLEFLKSL